MSPEVLQLRGAVQRLRDRCQHRQQFVEILGTSRSSPAAVPDDDRVLAVPRRPPLVLALVCALTEFRLATPTRTARGAPPRAPHTSPVPGHRRAAAGRDLTRQEMIHILTDAGCSPTSAGGRRGPSHPWSPTPAPTGTGSSASPSTAPRGLYRREGRRPGTAPAPGGGRSGAAYRWSSSKATSSTATSSTATSSTANGRPVLVFTAPNRLIAALAGPGQPMWAVRCRSLVPQSPSSSRGRPRGQRAARPRPGRLWGSVGLRSPMESDKPVFLVELPDWTRTSNVRFCSVAHRQSAWCCRGFSAPDCCCQWLNYLPRTSSTPAA